MRPIPFVDVRDGGPIAHARPRRSGGGVARRLSRAGAALEAISCLAPIDCLAANWLRSPARPMDGDLESVRRDPRFPGAMTINMSYLFACTTSAYAARPARRRYGVRSTGPFADLAAASRSRGDRDRREILHFHLAGRGRCAEAMAPGRYRRGHRWRRCAGHGRRPRLLVSTPRSTSPTALAQNGWPPDHLLRLRLGDLRRLRAAVASSLEPLARPVFFTFTGAAPGSRR